jgi:segregation and condensation protein A
VAYLFSNHTQDGSELEELVQLAKNSSKGKHVAISNPFEREIAIAFELILENKLDPWNIDLSKFTELYFNHLMNDNIDLPSAGILIVMAWRILKLQSDNVVEMVENEQIRDEIGWDEISALAGAEEFGANGFIPDGMQDKLKNTAILERIRRKSGRKVSLMELVDAFKSAFRDARLYLRKTRKNDERIKRDLEIAKDTISRVLCRENILSDIEEFWKKTGELDGDEFNLRAYYDLSHTEDFIKSILPCLFLAKEQKIDLRQENFPYGEIYIRKNYDHEGESKKENDAEKLKEINMEQNGQDSKSKRGESETEGGSCPVLSG